MSCVRIRARGARRVLKKPFLFFQPVMAATVVIVTMRLVLPTVSQAEVPVAEPSAVEGASGPLRYAGFSVFGPDWPVEETFATEAERLVFLEEQGYRIAQQTAQLSGNLVRVPISIWNVLNRIAPLAVSLLQKPIYQLDEKTLQAGWKDTQGFLDTAFTAFEKNQATAEDRPLRWDVWDAFFSGIQRANTERAATQGVPNSRHKYILLCPYIACYP